MAVNGEHLELRRERLRRRAQGGSHRVVVLQEVVEGHQDAQPRAGHREVEREQLAAKPVGVGGGRGNLGEGLVHRLDEGEHAQLELLLPLLLVALGARAARGRERLEGDLGRRVKEQERPEEQGDKEDLQLKGQNVKGLCEAVEFIVLVVALMEEVTEGGGLLAVERLLLEPPRLLLLTHRLCLWGLHVAWGRGGRRDERASVEGALVDLESGSVEIRHLTQLLARARDPPKGWQQRKGHVLVFHNGARTRDW